MRTEDIDKTKNMILKMSIFRIVFILIVLFWFGVTPGVSHAAWTIETIDSGEYLRGTSIAIDSNGKEHISYSALADLRYATNRGGSWLVETIDWVGHLGKTSIGIDSDDKIHISYYDSHTLRYATNKAGSWSIETIDSAKECSASIAIDSLGKVHMSYCGQDGVKYSTNKGGSWVIETVDDVMHTFYGTSIAIDSNDKAHISYFDRHESGLRYATNKGGSWSIESVDKVRTTMCIGNSSIAIDSNDNVHISYCDWDDCRYATNKGGSWSSEAVFGVRINPEGGDTSIAIDSNDNVHISYGDGHSLGYATNKRGWWSIETIDNAMDIGDGSIAIDSKDYVHIGFCDWNEVKYATNREVEIPVSIDIKPGSCPNPLNVKSQGVLPVAVIGTKDFDANSIDPGTIRLSREGIEGAVAPIRWNFEDVSAPFEGDFCDCHELKADGIIDLSLKFKTQQLVDVLKLKEVGGTTIEFTLRGNLKEEFDGTRILGRDCIRILMEKVNQLNKRSQPITFKEKRA